MRLAIEHANCRNSGILRPDGWRRDIWQCDRCQEKFHLDNEDLNAITHAIRSGGRARVVSVPKTSTYAVQTNELPIRITEADPIHIPDDEAAQVYELRRMFRL
ncbi:MAG: hypothetical protein C5B44_05655 [Acidobacteria bacterium]|nr:MAG: hypothetical protein C5B44_05655 [Acidobacteriota bacterium]